MILYDVITLLGVLLGAAVLFMLLTEIKQEQIRHRRQRRQKKIRHQQIRRM